MTPDDALLHHPARRWRGRRRARWSGAPRSRVRANRRRLADRL